MEVEKVKYAKSRKFKEAGDVKSNIENTQLVLEQKKKDKIAYEQDRDEKVGRLEALSEKKQTQEEQERQLVQNISRAEFDLLVHQRDEIEWVS